MRVRLNSKAVQQIRTVNAAECNPFLATSLAALEGDSAFGKLGLFRKKGYKRFVGFVVDGRRLSTGFEGIVFR